MSLLRRIQDAAVSSERPVSEVLRMCAVLAKRLGHAPLETWVQLELDGYPDPLQVPDYRQHPVQLVCQLVGPLGRTASSVPVPKTVIPEEYRDQVFNVSLHEGVEKLEAFADTDEKTVYMPLSQDLVLAYLNGKVFEGYTTVSATRPLPVAVIRGVVGTVRNKILAFALEIETENPEAGEAAPGEEPLPEQVVAQHFTTTILGGTNTIAVAGRDVAQSVGDVVAGDWTSLERALEELGVSTEDIQALSTALTEDSEEGTESVGPRTNSWLGRMMTKVQSGAVKLVGGVSVSVLAGLVLKYLGLGG